MKILSILTLAAAAALAGLGGYVLLRPTEVPLANVAPAEGPEHAEEAGDDHDEHPSTTLTPEAATNAGIQTETAGKTELTERLPLTGRIILNPETTAGVKARFPGVVKSVRKAIGQTVTKGETLATVESNDSLQTYAVTSPLAGVILARNINVGDTAAEQPMFTVANLASVMAEFHVFPKDLSRVQVGQQVHVQSVDGAVEATGTVKSLLPTTDADTQTVLAWVVLENTDGRWRAGMAIQGGAVISQQEVALAIKNTAIQTMEDKPVVFVKDGDTYTVHPVKLGRSDGIFTEVLEGLEPGSTYVSKNSFIVKADIGKSGANHSH